MAEPNNNSMQDLKPTVWIGKQGSTETMIEEIASQLKKRKIIKVKWLQNTEVDPEAIAAQAKAKLVEVRGRTMVLADKSRAPGTPSKPAKSPAKATAKATARASVTALDRSRAKAPAKSRSRVSTREPTRSAATSPARSPSGSSPRTSGRSPARSSAKTPAKETATVKRRQTGTMQRGRK
ncbi:YhbY family RNA-binding protein [Methanoregula sp.]|uniref:YhbY family RNA-binding protein n=1 Tax=Methanoregula sp. TaxID=2052170 RepID=UPI003434E16A